MPKRNLIIIVAIVATAVVIMWITRDQPRYYPADNKDPGHLSGVAEAVHIIRDNYYPIGDPAKTTTAPAAGVTEGEILRAMMQGVVHYCLDGYSRYVPPEDQRDFETLMSGKGGGIGLKVEFVSDDVRVVGCLLHSPAHRGGILPGDQLRAIDGLDVAGKTLAEIKRQLDGKVGSAVTLSILRGQTPMKVELVRQELAFESVEGLYRDGAGQWAYRLEGPEGFRYIRIKEFLPDTPERVQSALRSEEPIVGLILDLRGNPGGTFKSALAVADMFLTRGTICTVFSRNKPPQKHVAREKVGPDFPIIVLINGQSASAAEIVAGSLAINDRAVLVGTRTRGKGCMQQAFKLEGDLGQISLTTSEYLIGDDQPIAHRPGSDTWGVDPHQEVTMPEKLQDEICRMRLELELAPWPRTTAPTATQPTSAAAYSHELVLRDRQLKEAILLLQTPAQMKELLERASRDRQAVRAARAAKAQATTAKATETPAAP